MHDAKLCCELGRMYKYHKYFNALLFKAQVSYSVPTVGGRFGISRFVLNVSQASLSLIKC
jgi:hypothetical protein|nr:hypothetical protein GPGIFMOB_00187 [Acinetobacter gerneri]